MDTKNKRWVLSRTKNLALVAVLGTFLVSSVAGAQATPTADVQAQKQKQTGPSTDGPTIGNLSCFDYYHFGSIQADLAANLTQTVPGSTINFSGNVVNNNDYPVVEGTLIAKIFRRNDTTFKAGNGNELVDQVTVAKDMALPAKGSKQASFDWKVPTGARGGEYYAAYFFVTSERYNLMGLSFTEDVAGNQAAFTVKNDQDPKTVFLAKNDTTLNGQAHKYAASPLHFSADTAVTVKVKIINPSDKEKSIPVQWNQYSWDAIRAENRQNTKTELVVLKPNETKELSYDVLPTSNSIVFITATAQDNDSRSVLDIRYTKDGIEETRINFPSLTKFPLKAGEEQTLFACAHSTNTPLVKDNVLLLTLKDRNESVIGQYRYEGDISGAMSGFGDKLKPSEDYDYVTLEASLYRGGNEMEKVKITYDCNQIDPSTCFNQAGGKMAFWKTMPFLIAVGLFVLLAGALFLITRRKPAKIQW